MHWNGSSDGGLPSATHWITTAMRWLAALDVAAAALLLVLWLGNAIYGWAALSGIAGCLAGAPVIYVAAMALDCAIYAARTARDTQSRLEQLMREAAELRGVADTTAKRVDAVRTLAISQATAAAAS